MLFPVIYHRDRILLSTTYSMWEFLQYDMQPTEEHCLLLDVQSMVYMDGWKDLAYWCDLSTIVRDCEPYAFQPSGFYLRNT